MPLPPGGGAPKRGTSSGGRDRPIELECWELAFKENALMDGHCSCRQDQLEWEQRIVMGGRGRSMIVELSEHPPPSKKLDGDAL